MAVDLSKPLLRVEPEHHRDRRVGKASNIPKPKPFPPERQSERFGPKFERLAEVLARDPEGLVLSAAPRSLAPEIGRAHVCTPVTNALLVSRRLVDKKKK